MRFRIKRSWVVFLTVSCLVSTANISCADTLLSAEELANLVLNRKANEGRVGEMHFSLINSAGMIRKRQALMIHSTEEKTERIAIFFEYPISIADTAFLSFNHKNKDDENWLFLPATERIRRLPASDRGDYFLGTDLTYGDIQDNFKFNIEDWHFSLEPQRCDDYQNAPKLVGVARNSQIKEEMGYAKFTACVDVESAFPVWIQYYDKYDEPLKRVLVSHIEVIGGAHTAIEFMAENLQTGHTTHVNFKNMRYVPNLDKAVFDPDALAFGVPNLDE